MAAPSAGGGGSGEGSSSSAAVAAATIGPHGVDEEAMWQMNLGEAMEAGPYPERVGEPDCSYYMRTGLCRFGMTCKFNHPADRKLAVAAARMKGEYPQRIGQPECQYYLKTGTCKFGATCKFHHPREKVAMATQVQLNVLGFPLRPNEKECAYYLRTGQCKFGSTCKFHHPQPSNAMVAVRGSVYSPGPSATSPGQHTYPGAVTNWPLSRSASFIASPRWPGHSSYAQVIVPPGLVQVPGWNPYAAQLGSSSSDDQQRTSGAAQYYTGSRQSETPGMGDQGMFSSYQAGSVPVGLYAVQRENIFPERPDQPECQFYMKTGDCKFGAVCKFHHPKERIIPTPNCALTPLGLPLRPGEPLCTFYSRYGICKFGPNCKFDHPMGTVMYGLATSPTGEVPTARRMLAPVHPPRTLTSPRRFTKGLGPAAMAARLAQLRAKAAQASEIVAKHGGAYYKEVMEKNKQHVVQPPTVEKCQELSKQLFYTRLASLPGRYEAFCKELDGVKQVWKNRKEFKVEDLGIATLFGVELYAWFCVGEIVGRGFTLTGYKV